MPEHRPFKEFDVRFRKPGKRRWKTIKFRTNSAHPGRLETAEEVRAAFTEQIPGAEIEVTDLGWR